MSKTPPPKKSSTSASLSVEEGMPFIYTDWQQFTVKDGLPNDHIFAVKVDGPRVWVGTENGLALINKNTMKVERTWTEKERLPWRVVSSIDIDKKTGDVWLGLFGGGLARLSGYKSKNPRFDHWHQMNSGLVNDVVYGVAIENENIWAATTAGSSRFNMVSGEWSIFTEKNAPMEEIWNYGVSYADGKVFFGVWGSGILEYDVAEDRWKDYLDPDGEMEIDLYRDDGIVHVITTGVSYIDHILWASSYFGGSRYDGRNWRGFFNKDSGIPSDFINFVEGRNANEAWYCTDKGVGAIVDFPSNTWVTYTRDPQKKTGWAEVYRNRKMIRRVETGINIPHNYALAAEVDGKDIWVGTSKGLAFGKGTDYFPRLKGGKK